MSDNLQEFPIVGIGASAGGLEALEALFKGIPDRPGMGFIVITHISPDHESQLPSIIERFTSLTVLPAADGMKVEPDHVYVLTQGALLTIKGGVLQVEALPLGQHPRKPIDVFLGSLAEDQGDNAVSIILSGSDGDGALGSKAVKEVGGLTLAQVGNGTGPAHPEMPNTAIATGQIDFALHASEMGQRLLAACSGVDELGMVKPDMSAGDQEVALENARTEICNIIKRQIGHDFQNYKLKTFFRRVYRRMKARHADTIENYLQLLQGETTEVEALFQDLLINVTSFFRDQDAFESLANTVIPKLFEERDARDMVRVWIPGCSTGEEVYSIAILLREHMQTLRLVPRVQIFATDIDETALNVARDGRYPEILMTAVSPEQKEKYFYRDAGHYVVKKEIRDLCIFSAHSLIRDPPFSHIDFISCRNLLIYLGQAAQTDVIPIFHYSLRPSGYLFLGMAESISQFDDLFTPVDREHRIFRRRDDAVRRARLPLNIYTGRLQSTPADQRLKHTQSGIGNLQQVVDSQVLDRHAPAHLVANAEGAIVYFSSRTGSYLETPAGFPTRDIADLARRGIRLGLMSAFREAVDHNRSITQVGVVPTEGGDAQIIVDITVEPLDAQNREDRLFLVLFEDRTSVSVETANGNAVATVALDPAVELRRELSDLKKRLQATMEEYETSIEEVRLKNEELISVNEELQSANEELEASKEEQQSVNEELQTVNHELSAKITALDVANSDLRNLFESTQIATLFLDRGLAIRSFTPAVIQVFNVLPGDRGRSIKDLASRFDTSGLEADIHKALTEGAPVERQMWDTVNSVYYLVKCSPYRSLEGGIDGVVVSFVDVTRVTRAEEEQERLRSDLVEAQKMEAVAHLTGAVAHDFNNLLHVILMKCQALELQRSGDTDSLEKLSAIRTAIRTCQQIIISLLLVAKQRPLDLRLTDVRQVLEDNSEIVRTAAMPCSIDYQLSSEPLIVMADNSTLASAILNLSINARDAMPDGGNITISCSPAFIDPVDPLVVSHDLKVGKYAEVSVTDKGHGMTSDVLLRAFEPFFSTKEPGKGTGLGLSGVDRLCRQLHGAVALRNNDAGGLTVRVLIPLSSAEGPTGSTKPLRGHEDAVAPLRILVVDDNDAVAASTKELLTLFGHDVSVAANGEEALAKLGSQPFDFMFCDINMPGMMGPDVAAAAEVIQPSMSIFLITGFADGPTEDFKWRVLEKPVDPEVLLSLLSDATVMKTT